MECLKDLGFAEYYYLDNDKIYNAERKRYLFGVGEYRYKLRTKEGKNKSITIKEIYKRLYNKVFCIDNIERLEGEEFREIKGTEGNYLVSNYGRVMSYRSNYAVLLSPCITPKGYERLQIIIEGQRCNKFVHCLVAETWLGSPENIGQEVHHKDFNQRNNKVTNLQYVTKNEHIKKHIERGKIECKKS